MPLIITILKLRTLCSPQYYLRSALPYILSLVEKWTQIHLQCTGVTSICRRSKNLNLSWRTLSLWKWLHSIGAYPTEQSVRCLQDGFRSIFAPGKQNIKIFSNLKLHKFFSLKLSARSSKWITNGREFQVNFCNAIGRDKKQLLHKSWPIRLTRQLSQGNFAMKFQHVLVTKCGIMALYSPKLLRSLYLENIFSVYCHVHTISSLHFWLWIELVN